MGDAPTKTIRSPHGNKYLDYGYQVKFLYEIPPGKGAYYVMEVFKCSDEEYRKLWGQDPMPFGKPIQRRFEYDPAKKKQFKKEWQTQLRLGDLPCCPDRLRGHEITCHKLLKEIIASALSRVFTYADEIDYKIKTIGCYVDRSIRGKPGSLSNHALGAALDINEATNRQCHRMWDMPPGIVRIMMEHGFGWGGIYRPEKGKDKYDAMHFEYRCPYFRSASAAPLAVIPIVSDHVLPTTPVKLYWNTEAPDTGAGGYYALGLHRNIHGGIHLVPDNIKTVNKVRAVAPGYIVAVRLPRLGDDEDQAVAEEAAQAEKARQDEAAKNAAKPPSKAQVKQNQAKTAKAVEKALAPIVAAKNWTGFVLVRHDLRLRTDPQKDYNGKLGGPFYSLYMHLAPLKAKELTQDNWATSGVEWFNQLLVQRYGTFTKIVDDPDIAVGTTYWAAEPYVSPPAPGQVFKVYGYSGGKAKGKKAKKADGLSMANEQGQQQWLWKSATVDFEKAAQAIAEGMLVTFNEPFFTVDEGDVLGILAPRPREDKGTSYQYKDAQNREQTAHLPAKFLHWEIFAPLGKGGKSTLQDLLSTAESVEPLMGVFDPAKDVIKEIEPNNFLEVNELRQRVFPRLSSDEQTKVKVLADEIEALEKKVGHQVAGRPSQVVGFFADGTTFAPKTECDSVGEFVNAPFTYPIELHLECEHLVAPADLASGDSYEITVDYCTLARTGKDEVKEKSLGQQVLKLDAGKVGKATRDAERKNHSGLQVVRLTLHVPAQTDRIRLTFRGQALLLSTPRKASSDDGSTLLGAMVKTRWRGSRIEHVSEWTPESVEALFKKSKELHLLPEGEEPEPYYKVAWWHTESAKVQRDKMKPAQIADGIWRAESRETVKAVSDKSDVFGSDLPTDAKVDNVHPVTAAWLLAILQRRKLAEFKIPNRAVFDPEDPAPLAMGWVVDDQAPVPKLGDPIHALVVDEDFGYDKSLVVTVSAQRPGLSLPIVQQHGYGENGVIAKALTADFWGDFRLVVEGSTRTPAVIGKAVLSLPEPKLQDTLPADAQAGRYLPRKRGRMVFWSVKLAPDSAIPTRLPGYIGVELSVAGRPWLEPKVDGKRLGIFAIAAGTGGQSGSHVITEGLEIANGVILGPADPVRNPNPLVTKSFRLLAYQRANHEVHVAYSLVEALVALGVHDDEVHFVDRAGTTCVLRSKSWRRLWNLAYDCLKLPERFRHVGIPRDTELLTLAELDQAEPQRGIHSERMHRLMDRGLKLGIGTPLAKLSECPLLNRDGLEMSRNGLFIDGVPDKKAKVGKEGNLTVGAFVGKCPVHISTQLADGMEELYVRSKKKPVPLEITWDGDVCEIGDVSLLDQALDIPHFTRVQKVDEGKVKRLCLMAPRGLSLAFDPTLLLTKIRDDQIRNGQLKHDKAVIDYRYYFSAVNGLSLRLPAGYPEENGVVMPVEDRNGLNVKERTPPAVVEAKCQVSCGTMHRIGVRSVDVRAVDQNLLVKVALLGDRTAWAEGKVELAIPGAKGKNAKTKVFPVEDGQTEIKGEIPRPGGTELAVLITTYAKDEVIAVNTVPVNLTPRLQVKPTFAAIGDHAVIWCRLDGVVACRLGIGNLVFDKDQLVAAAPAKAQRKRGRPYLFTLSVRASGGEARRIEYYLPVVGGGGYVGPDGVFAARTPRSGLYAEESYEVSLQARDPARGDTVILNAKAKLVCSDGQWRLDNQ